ncbi:MAG: dihydropteroate synthase [Phycisphaerae bacterium]|nr:dihydropteroate synthase [Phycisphaerae bacterium]
MSLTDSNSVWRLAHGRSLPLDRDVLIMGIVNVTPDSFSDGGLFVQTESAIAHGLMLCRTDADILDIGGESTRPGSEPVPPAEQIRRVLPVVRRLADMCPKTAISIDTQSAEVAQAALDMGAHIINDISALRADPDMARLAAESGAGLVLMHMLGTPATMQSEPQYRDVVAEVRDFLDERVRFALDAGVGRDHIAIDPGVGFGKNLQHNLQLLANVDRLVELGLPVMVGPSRKRFIGDLAGAPVNERLAGTLSACVMAALGGAKIVRVHNPGPVRQAIKVALAVAAHRRSAEQSAVAPAPTPVRSRK